MQRKEATAVILNAKRNQAKSFKDLAAAVGGHPVWVTSAIMGQQRLTGTEASRLCTLLGLGQDVEQTLQSDPDKDPSGPLKSDPLVYRLGEVVQVYGVAMKALIEEEFGDGIMSAIDFHMDIEREKNPAGDRVVITMNGKFLPYKKW